MVKNPLGNEGDVRDVGSIPGSGRSSGGGHGNLLQYPWRIPMDIGAYSPQGYKVSDMNETT